MKSESPRTPMPLGDIPDLDAHLLPIVRKLPARLKDDRDIEELLGIARVYAVERHNKLPAGESLRRALTARWLQWRFSDDWRRRHPEWRRNTRAGTSTSVGAPIALPDEPDTTPPQLQRSDDTALVSSRALLASLTNATQLRDPRVTGALVGMPSWHALATGQSNEIWETILQERRFTGTTTIEPGRFTFRLDPDDIT